MRDLSLSTTHRWRLTSCLCILVVASFWASRFNLADEPSLEGIEFFEKQVRPVLVESCLKCHGPKKQEADLRFDSAEGVMRGGVSGQVIEPGKPAASLLVKAIHQQGELKMPPDKKLTPQQIAAIEKWIALGAPWPHEAQVVPVDLAAKHWAFQPIRDPVPPQIAGVSQPIDQFVRAKLSTVGLKPAALADRRTLIRRLTFDLTGLPPSAEEVESFVKDSDPLAYEKLVESLLNSPHYGEQWGRHWLDVARYSDTKGYVYAREQRFWLQAANYRDWVVRAFNEDMPYNQFVLLQIAADQVQPSDRSALAAAGFLTLNRRFLGVTHDIIDDRIDVVSRGMLGLTVGCARCHDHKYDPIPTRDYYSLYGVFQSSAEFSGPTREPTDAAFQTELAKRQQKLDELRNQRRREWAERVRSRTGEYLQAQLELHKYPEEGFDQILQKSDLLPAFVRRWRTWLANGRRSNDPLQAAWHAYAAIPSEEFSVKSAEVTKAFQHATADEVHPLIVARFVQPPASMSEVATRYGELFQSIEMQWQAAIKQAAVAKQPAPSKLEDPQAETVRQALYGANSPCVVPDEPLVNIEYFMDTAACEELWKTQNQVDNWILQSAAAPPWAVYLQDREPASTPRVFKRGNPAQLGDEIPRQFLSLLAGKKRTPFQKGSGRLELAQAIIDPANPLTARVIVNRIWLHHFGAGLVRTTSDFGLRAENPTHPELLDWLAKRFVENNWSIKKLHRLIVHSETYRQASSDLPAADREQALRIDPENRLLWRFSLRRLSFEEMRDALYSASGELDLTVGGRAADLFAGNFRRRTMYGLIDRQFLPNTLRFFDFANPDLHIPLRSETIVPQQALFFLNHPLLLQRALQLSQRTAQESEPNARLNKMFLAAYQRMPTTIERERMTAFLNEPAASESPKYSPNMADWQYGYGKVLEKEGKVIGFEKLPHFTGTAWQGGTAWPDAKLGWVQLTATGGHAGNDLKHAAVRRWTAPRAMQIRLQSELLHETTQGDGVRGFLISSRQGILANAKVHNNKGDFSREMLDVEAGEILDFAVDIGGTLNNDQFRWPVSITSIDKQNTWNSVADFPPQPRGDQLNPWEQLAQILLSSNEFIFVD